MVVINILCNCVLGMEFKNTERDREKEKAKNWVVLEKFSGIVINPYSHEIYGERKGIYLFFLFLSFIVC